MPRTVHALDTHLHPGARLTEHEVTPLRRGSTVSIEFADLARATARVTRKEAGRFELSVDAHRTSRGTVIPAKNWLVEQVDVAAYRVIRRLPGTGQSGLPRSA